MPTCWPTACVALGQRAALHEFGQLVDDLAAVEDRDGQQVQHEQTHAHDRKEGQERKYALSRRETGVFRDVDRAAQVLDGDVAGTDVPEQPHCQDRHVPGLVRRRDQARRPARSARACACPRGSRRATPDWTPMRPTSFDPSRWASTSTGTTTRSPARSIVNSSVLPGCGCTSFTSAGKSATGVPSTATIRSPAAGPRARPGCPAASCRPRPARPGTRTRTRAPAAMRPARSAAADCPRSLSGATRVRAVGRTNLERDRARHPSTGRGWRARRLRACRSRERRRPTISSPDARPACAAIDCGATSPSTGFSAGMPATKQHPVRGCGKQEICEGPGEQHEDALPDGLAVVGRGQVGSGDRTFTLVEKLYVTA